MRLDVPTPTRYPLYWRDSPCRLLWTHSVACRITDFSATL